MEKNTVCELREIAKSKNMIGYYKLRKADLITAISKHGGSVMDLLYTPSNSIFRLKDKICIYIRMNNQKSKTIRELRDIAKRKNMVGYYKLRKADLITAISKQGGGVMDNDEKKKINLLDTPVPDNGKHPILTPNKYFPSPIKSSLNKSIFNELKNKVRSKINSFADWIVNFIPKPEQKLAINQKLESLKSNVKSLFVKVHTKKFKI